MTPHTPTRPTAAEVVTELCACLSDYIDLPGPSVLAVRSRAALANADGIHRLIVAVHKMLGARGGVP